MNFIIQERANQMDLTAYQEKYSDIITGIQPWQSPDGQPDPSRQSVLTNGMGRLIRVDNQMCKTTVAKDGLTGMDPDFKMEDRLMNGGVSVKATSDKSTKDFLRNKGRLTSIPVASIIADPIFQMRANGTDDVIVRRYAEIMDNNNPNGWQIFPRITVLALSDIEDERYAPEKYYVIGGFHRLAAMQDRGYKDIEAVVVLGTTADGIVFAAGENDDKSVRRTLKDIRRAVLSCLKHPEIKGWVNPKIAEICAVDVQTVRNWEIWLYRNDPDYSRPEKLKFRDKYGGVGLRKHSIPNFAVEPDVIEIEEKRKSETAIINLRSQLGPKYETIIAYTADPNPELQEQRETDLLTRFPDLSLYKLLDSLSHEDLLKLETALTGAMKFVRKEKKKVQDEIRDIRHDEIKLTQLQYAMENHEVILRKRQKALHDRFPALKEYDDSSIWDLAFSSLLNLRKGMIEAHDYLAENGDKEFLPQEYFDATKAMNQAKKDAEALEGAIKEFCDIQEQVQDSLIDYVEKIYSVEKDGLAWRVEQQAWEVFKAKYNQSCENADAHDVKIIKKMEERSSWEIKRKTGTYSLENLQDYIRRWKPVLKLLQDGHALLKDKEAAHPSDRLFFEKYPDALQTSMSIIEIRCTGFDRHAIADDTLKSRIPLSEDEILAVAQTAIESAQKKLEDIRLQRMNPAVPEDLPVIELDTNRDSAKGNTGDLPTFKTVKYAKG